MFRWRGLLIASATSAVLSAAGGCGGNDKPKVFSGNSGEVPPDTSLQTDASTKPPSCGIPQPTVCDCVDVPLLTDAPNLYFVLDRSGSMAIDGKWNVVRGVVQKLVRSIGPRASFGLALFPHPQLNNCNPGIQVMSVRPGDAPAGSTGPTLKTLIQAMAPAEGGGTPTGLTLRGLKSTLTALPGRTYVVLATDGAPNCNGSATCDISLCTPNIEAEPGCDSTNNCCLTPPYGPQACVDVDTVTAVKELADANIPTYVIGVPGSAPYAKVLDDMATAGGTARAQSPFYYRVDSADETALLDAMREVAAKIVASCTLPVGEVKDPNLINLYFDEQPVPRDGQEGWTMDSTTITLHGLACDKVMSGAVLDVRVIGGCPTIIK